MRKRSNSIPITKNDRETKPKRTKSPLPSPVLTLEPGNKVQVNNTNETQSIRGPKFELGNTFKESELVIGLVGPAGTPLSHVSQVLKGELSKIGYTDVLEIHISEKVFALLWGEDKDTPKEGYEKIEYLMNRGNAARHEFGNHVLALGAATLINKQRPVGENGMRCFVPKKAYIINSLKHPEEVKYLREIYAAGFYLIGAFAEIDMRIDFLVRSKNMNESQAKALIERDENENLDYGQKTRDTFHLSDFFVHDDSTSKLKNSLKRILQILFGHRYKTPTFDEFAMFMAFSTALRSADLSRQVGAVVANQQNEIIATGANDCPKYGGGLYWPKYTEKHGKNAVFAVMDDPGGRDYRLGEDSNDKAKIQLFESITEIASKVARITFSNLNDSLKQQVIEELKQKAMKKQSKDSKGNDSLLFNPDVFRKLLEESSLDDITEYGRVVHAEMEALLFCSRNHITTRGATLYCTTFPCHNCAKHIIAAGIERVVFIEPYPKSKAGENHKDSMIVGMKKAKGKVWFEPFVGIGPRRFFDLFSMKLGSGYPIMRKNKVGKILKETDNELRIQMLPGSYLDKERLASHMIETMIGGEGNGRGGGGSV